MALGTALAFVASLGIGFQAIAVNAGMDRVERTSTTPAAFSAAFVSIAVSVLLFWSLTIADGVPIDAISLSAVAPFLAAGVLYPMLFRVLYFEGIDRIGVNIASAIMASNPAVAALLAVPFLGERTTYPTAGGLLLIVAGGALLQLVYRRSDGEGIPTDLIVRELSEARPRDFLFPLGSAVSVGAGYVLIKTGLDGFPHPIAATAMTQTAALASFLGLLVAAPGVRQQVRVGTEHRPALGFFVLAGLCIATAWVAQFFALQVGSVVTTVPLINTFPLVIAVVSYLLAREFPRSPRVLAGIAAIVIGASVMELL